MSTLAPTERRFGVEIECGHPRGTSGVITSLRKYRIPHEDVGSDGSGVEVRTRPLRGKEGFRKLKKLMDHLQKIGCYITQADGQHIHLEAKDYEADPELRARLIESYAANREHIIKFVDPYRRNYGSCSNVWEGSRKKKPNQERLRQVKQGVLFGRGDLNLSNLREGYHGTIEIRLHEGNLEFEKIQAWIHFWMDFLDRVKASDKPLRPYANEHTLFRGIHIDPVMRAKLREAAKRYNDPGRTPIPTYSSVIRHSF